MHEDLFTPTAPGRLVRVDGGLAFLPDLLPFSPANLNSEVVMALSEADAELGRLDGHAGNLPNPEILIGPFLRREALLSSRIEGTQTSYSELFLFEAEEDANPTNDTREVDNYVQALQYGVRRVRSVSLSRGLLLELHQLLMRGTDEVRTRPGRFRESQVYIAPPGVPMSLARFVPPPALEVPALFDNFIEYVERPERLPLLIRLAIAHYQFETIHPFLDGNGRLGRLLMVLMLVHERRISAPMLYLSAYFERRRAQYYDLMLRVSTHGDWQSWFRFFLDAVATQARDAIARTSELQALREEYRRRLVTRRRTAASLTLVDRLFELPVMTVPMAGRLLSYSPQAAGENVQKLVDANILTKLESSGRKQYFLATEIISILDRAEVSTPAFEAGPDHQSEAQHEVTQVR